MTIVTELVTITHDDKFAEEFRRAVEHSDEWQVWKEDTQQITYRKMTFFGGENDIQEEE